MNELTQSSIEKPFNPSQIEIEKRNISINSLVLMLQTNMIDLAPAYQRKGNLWSEEKQSQLIESLLLKIPLPSIYLEFDAKNKKYIVIDGLQRLFTIKNFAVDKTLRLKGLEFLKDQYGGLGYDDLDFTDKVAIGLEELTANILKGTSPTAAKIIIFQRLNTGGEKLSRQEIRNALNQGPGNHLIIKLADTDLFRNMKISSKRMEDNETVLRLLAFMILGVEGYSGRMNDFLDSTIVYLNSLTSDELNYIESRFKKALMRCHEIMGGRMFILPGKKKISVSYSDAFLTTVSEIDDETFGALKKNFKKFQEDLSKKINEDEDFRFSLSNKSDQKMKTVYRHTVIQDLINNCIC